MKSLNNVAVTLLTISAIIYIPCVVSGQDAPAPAPSAAPASNPALPDGKGKAELMNTCTQCHALSQITQKRLTKDEWSTTVDQMQERGAQATDEQIDLILDYLAAHFGKPIYVNTAPVETLQDAFAMTPQEAAVLVKYRQENGNFKTLDDLLKIPGIDARKIQDQSGNIVFDSKTP